MDLFSTFLDLAGVEEPSDRVVDGHSLRKTMLDQEEEDRPVFFYRCYLNSLSYIFACTPVSTSLFSEATFSTH